MRYRIVIRSGCEVEYRFIRIMMSACDVKTTSEDVQEVLRTVLGLPWSGIVVCREAAWHERNEVRFVLDGWIARWERAGSHVHFYALCDAGAGRMFAGERLDELVAEAGRRRVGARDIYVGREREPGRLYEQLVGLRTTRGHEVGGGLCMYERKEEDEEG